MKNELFNKISIALYALIIICFTSCERSVEPNSKGTGTGTGGGACSIESISTSGGYKISYSYNSEQKIEKANLPDGEANNTFTLSYDKTQTNGPVVSIGNPAKSSLTVLTYSKDNLLQRATTTIAKKDAGTILGKPATITNFKNELYFEWNSSKQLVTQTTNITSIITVDGVSEPFDIDGYLSYEYETNGDLLRINTYTLESLNLGGEVVLRPGELLSYKLYEYETDVPEIVQKTGSTGLFMDFKGDGQILFIPKTKKTKKKTITYYDDGDGGFTPIEINYINTKNASGFLSKAVADGTFTTTYNYNNCK